MWLLYFLFLYFHSQTVRLHEKPAKVVKARLSMKRKLLQGSDSAPATVEIFGPWQVEPYVPPKAENGIVPRNAHGNVDLFKPCMLPIGCAHLCLSGMFCMVSFFLKSCLISFQFDLSIIKSNTD